MPAEEPVAPSPSGQAPSQPRSHTPARPQPGQPASTSYPGERPPPAYAPAHMRQRAAEQHGSVPSAAYAASRPGASTQPHATARRAGSPGQSPRPTPGAPAGVFPPTRSAARPTAGPRYGAPPPTGPTPQPRQRRRHPIRTFILLLLAALIAWPTFLYIDATNNLRRVDALSGAADTPGTTWLLAGSDSRAEGPIQDNTEGERADTIMLVHQAENGQASAISLPRDTWVEIPGYGWDKLNAAYALGGPSLLVESVETLSGLTVDHYVEIGMGGVGSIVDAVGGVELCLDMDVNDPLSELVWESGCHLSDGKTALAFARMRYADPLGDIGRAERQRQVVTKTVKKALAPSTLLWPPSALSLERAGSQALRVNNEASTLAIGRMVFAFRQAGSEGLTGAPPIASLNYETEAGSAVLLVDDTAPDFFDSLRQGTLTPEDLKQELL